MFYFTLCQIFFTLQSHNIQLYKMTLQSVGEERIAGSLSELGH